MIQSTWFLLILLGIFASILASIIDEAVLGIIYLHQELLTTTDNYWMKLLLFLLFRVLILLSGIAIVHSISPNSVGSGIPEMRSILGGFSLPLYLSRDALMAKSIGLVCALGSGLSIGKEGPFVHLSCIIATQLLKLKWFRQIYRSPDLTHHVLSAACALGVTATFGAPIGGVLYGIEVTTTYYMTSNYWRAFFCSVVGVVVFRSLKVTSVLHNSVSLFTTEFQVLPYQVYEVFLFLILAAICGVFAGLFIRLFSKVVAIRREYQTKFLGSKPFKFAALVSILFGLAEYLVGSIMVLSNREAIDDLFVATNITDLDDTHLAQQHNASWNSPSLVVNLVLFAIVRFFATAFSAAVAIPNGIVTPIFAVGAAVGRLYGEIISFMGGGSQIPGGYAVVGAASFTAGVTGTVSIAVIVFELTSQLSYMIPVLLSVLIGRTVASFIALDIYETIGRDRNLPQWPDLSKQKSYSLVASDLMRALPSYYMSRRQTLTTLRELLRAFPAVNVFPIVDDANNMIYFGVAARYELEALVDIWSLCLSGVTSAKRHEPELNVLSSIDSATLSPTARFVRAESQQVVAGLTSDQSAKLQEPSSEDKIAVDLVGLGLLVLDSANFHVCRDNFSSQAILLMSVHKTSQLFVTNRGQLIGVIEASDLKPGGKHANL